MTHFLELDETLLASLHKFTFTFAFTFTDSKGDACWLCFAGQYLTLRYVTLCFQPLVAQAKKVAASSMHRSQYQDSNVSNLTFRWVAAKVSPRHDTFCRLDADDIA